MKKWHYAAVEERRQVIRDELNGLEQEAPSIMEHLLAKIELYSDSVQPDDLLNCFLYILFSLSYSSKYRYLSIKQSTDLANLAKDILRLQRIDLKCRSLGSLARDLHVLISQDARSKGDHLRSFWELAIGSRFVDKNTAYRHSTKALALAIRQQRLGYVAASLTSLAEVLEAADSESNALTAKVQYVKGLRLSRKWTEHGSFAEELLSQVKDVSIRRELEWERLCIGASESHRFHELFSAVNKPGGNHHLEFYFLEAMLWSFASPVKAHSSFFAQVESVSRRRDMQFNKKEPLFQFCRDFQSLLGNEFPMERRLRLAYELFERAKQLPGVDHELLALLGLARMLLRKSQIELGSMVLEEYRALCLKCTVGESADVLNLAESLTLNSKQDLNEAV